MKHNFKIHNMFYLGYVVLNSRTAYGKNKKNVTYYAFKTTQKDEKDLMIVPYKKSSKQEQTNVYIMATKNVNQGQNQPNHIIMTIHSILGPVGKPEAEHKYLLYKHSLAPLTKKPSINPRQYYQDVIDEEISKRIIKTTAVTIDPEGSQDHDDAVSINITDKDYIIGVHIADVSFLISPGSQLDNYAKESYTTVYSSHLSPINMLPSYICNELLSLKENGKRLCVSVYYHYKNNEHTDTTIVRDAVTIAKNCTYQSVRKHITKDQWKALTTATKTTDSHKIVETLMLKTNTLIARKLATKSPNSCILRAQKESINDSIFFRARANYIIGSTKETHHHDLNEEYYTHFTSPLRRYADIIAHRQLFSKDYYTTEDIINEINDVNKRCSKLKSDEHKLQLIYDLEKLWKQGQIVLQLQSTIVEIEENQVYLHTKFNEKDFLLRLKTEQKIEKNQQVIIEILPYANASIFSKKLKIKLIHA